MPLEAHLERIVNRDPEQEVRGIAVPVVDAVISAARDLLPADDPVVAAIRDVISVKTIDEGDSIRGRRLSFALSTRSGGRGREPRARED